MWWIEVVRLAPPVLAIGAACAAAWYAVRAHRARIECEAEARRAEHYAARIELARKKPLDRAKQPRPRGVTHLG